ncbi:hypothetical protein V8C37DRAFT_402571 [Trichoderma ceciliae]
MDILMPTVLSYRAFLSIKMMLLRLLVAIFLHLPIVLSFPHLPDRLGLHDRGLTTEAPPSTTIRPIPIPIPTTTGDPWKDMCKPGAECDCTRIKDKNGEEYFQCVTNPRCDHCWINITVTTTTTTTTTPPPTRLPPSTPLLPVTDFLSTDYQTLLPGTYTSSSNGTAHVVIVQQPSQPTSISVVTSTLTLTSFVTASVTPVFGVSRSGAGSAVWTPPSADLQPSVERRR